MADLLTSALPKCFDPQWNRNKVKEDSWLGKHRIPGGIEHDEEEEDEEEEKKDEEEEDNVFRLAGLS